MDSTQEIATSNVSAPDNLLGLSEADRRTYLDEVKYMTDEKTGEPRNYTMADLRDDKWCKDLVGFVKQHPWIDFVIRFDLPPHDTNGVAHFQGFQSLHALPSDTGKGIFVAGSGPLNWMMQYILGYNKVKWKSSDVDIFFLNCIENTRMANSPGNVDMVFCKDKTIEEVLLNFDLPCCRVGYDFKYNFYVSIQAIVAILTGKMFLPNYMGSNIKFNQKLKDFAQKETKYDMTWVRKMIIKRFYERVKKYESRGIKTIYTHLDYVLPWVRNRFTYVDFDNPVSVYPYE